MVELTSRVEQVMNCPKGIIIWNYFDHEHVVGTHFKHYQYVKVHAEAANWCFSERSAKVPFIPLALKAQHFSVLESENLMRSYHTGIAGLLLQQEFHFEDLGPNACRVTVVNKLEVPAVLKFLQPLFSRLTAKWFQTTWVEDVDMRLRRLKLWQLGFQDFIGLDYVNKKTPAPARPNTERPYPIQLPVPKLTEIKTTGIRRPFAKSEEVGYGLPDLQ
ncbi:MAG: hypothetical protein HYR63_25075 [Proteobacteria bacterium]|nr:hypothetical protein [Pseudomonadota bacterium]MBI3497202.1 hypothetical protein [Pseudomonadota bacterium]